MTKGEAINWLINLRADIGKIEHQELWHYEQALAEIMEMIDGLPSAQPEILACGEGELNVPDTNVGDMISRQAAIKAICEDGTWLESQGCTEITMAERKQRDADILGELPSVERKKGEWIDMNTLTTMYMPRYKCSICDEWANKSNYCPNCGADMRGERE